MLTYVVIFCCSFKDIVYVSHSTNKDSFCPPRYDVTTEEFSGVECGRAEHSVICRGYKRGEGPTTTEMPGGKNTNFISSSF